MERSCLQISMSLIVTHHYPTRFQKKQDDIYYQDLCHLDNLFDKVKGRGTERYKAYENVCTFLIDFQLWKIDDIFRTHLEALLHRILTKEIPEELENVEKWVYDPELILAIYNDPELEISLYNLKHTMTTLQKMMQ
jgi:broad-specificity NMP kinase